MTGRFILGDEPGPEPPGPCDGCGLLCTDADPWPCDGFDCTPVPLELDETTP